MKLQKLSVERFMRLVGGASVLCAAFLLFVFYRITGSAILVCYGALLIAVFFAWEALFLLFLQKRLSAFTNSLCLRIDAMIDGTERPRTDFEAETSLSRISHRLERLYGIMQIDRRQVSAEKAELQSLMSDISHQTKTPIANLKMINDTMMNRRMPEEKQREFLQASESQLEKLDFLIQAMVKSSRLETGVITLERKRTLLEDTLTTAINGILVPMEQKKIELSVDCPENLTLSHDSRWTAEAVYNLLDNAVKYTPVGGSICIKVQDWEIYLRIDVSDTGRGIPEREQASIFRRFYREDTVHDIDGIGIGLYLTREIVTRQGGYVKVSSAVGKGSVFSIFLPKT